MKSEASKPPFGIWLVQILSLAGANFATGALCLLLAYPSGSAPTVWPPAGIALAAMLLLGFRVWPGVWLGSFLAVFASFADTTNATALYQVLAVAAGSGFGDVLQAAAGAWLVRRLLGGAPDLESLKDVVVLLVVAASVGATVVCATVGTAAIAAYAEEPFWSTWWAAWRADVVGVLVFAPPVLIGAKAWPPSHVAWNTRRALEAALLVVCFLAYAFLLAGRVETHAGAVLVTVFSLWSALRFGATGTAVGMVVLTALMVWHVHSDEILLLGVIKAGRVWRVMTAQTLLGFLGLTYWILSAVQQDRQKILKTLRDSEASYRSLVEMSPDCVLILEDGRIRYGNTAALALLGAPSLEAILDKPVREFLHPDDHAASASRLRQVVKTGHPVPPYHYRARRLDGQPLDVESRAGPCVYGGVKAVQVVSHDISARKRAEEELRAARERLQHVIDSSPSVLYTLALEGERIRHFAWMGDNVRDLIGCTSDQICASDWWCRHVHPEDRDRVLEKVERELFSHGRVANEYRVHHWEGGYRWIRSELRLLRDAAGQPVEAVGSWSDVTERRQAEERLFAAEAALHESELRYSDLFESTSDCLFMLDVTPDGRFRFAGLNPAEERVVGLKSADVLGKLVEDVVPEALARQVTENYRRCAESGAVLDYEEQLELPTGRRHFHTILVPQRSAAGRVHRIDGVAREITDRKRALEILRASLREKEALLKEVHHRVKNNLQIISSLLNLQADQVRDPAALAVLGESQNRVRAMALVHETLYRSENFARIDLAVYLEGLCAQLLRAYGTDPERVCLELQVPGTTLDLDRAIPCGLLVNELVSNALKYAFPDGRQGRLEVALGTQDGVYALAVGDDGIGLPEGLDFRSTRTLGLQLVCGIAQQLGGTVELDRTGGTRFTITFARGPHGAGGAEP
jgi:PAS domain S-box-containing protein